MELPEIMTICLAQCNKDYCSYVLHTQKQTASQVLPPAKECEKIRNSESQIIWAILFIYTTFYKIPGDSVTLIYVTA